MFVCWGGGGDMEKEQWEGGVYFLLFLCSGFACRCLGTGGGEGGGEGGSLCFCLIRSRVKYI